MLLKKCLSNWKTSATSKTYEKLFSFVLSEKFHLFIFLSLGWTLTGTAGRYNSKYSEAVKIEDTTKKI